MGKWHLCGAVALGALGTLAGTLVFEAVGMPSVIASVVAAAAVLLPAIVAPFNQRGRHDR